MGAETLESIRVFAGRQRAFVKVQDGCDAFCTYCIVPHLRRRVWSRPGDEVVAEVEALVAGGHREIVLCGVSLGAYGQPTTDRARWTSPPALGGLLRRVAEVDGLWRVRLSSLHPADVTDELLAVFAECPTVAPHLHLPLQSGGDRVLERMNRRYTAAEFLAAVAAFRGILDRPAVTTDVIVGFPGEDEQDFQATLDVAAEAGFCKIHVFPFSPRRGTPVWPQRQDAPPTDVVKARCRRLTQLEGQLARAFRAAFIGRTVEVLAERPNTRTPRGFGRGLTDRYVEVTFPAGDARPAELAGRILRVRITGPATTGLAGEIVPAP